MCTRGFSAYYSVDVVVRAFADVKKAYPGAKLDLVGGGPLEADVRKLVADLKLSDVNFAGVASREQIGKCHDQADISSMSSWLDNMPVSIIEAFAAGDAGRDATCPESIPYLVEHRTDGLLSPVETKKPSPPAWFACCRNLRLLPGWRRMRMRSPVVHMGSRARAVAEGVSGIGGEMRGRSQWSEVNGQPPKS